MAFVPELAFSRVLLVRCLLIVRTSTQVCFSRNRRRKSLDQKKYLVPTTSRLDPPCPPVHALVLDFS
jgi:hypothetical protein